MIHLGAIATADTVMKSGYHRDKYAAEQGIIAFEMEGAGFWEKIPSVIIKGVCDYADSHKNKQWQDNAATTAAACAKAFLEVWVPSPSSSPPLLSPSKYQSPVIRRSTNDVQKSGKTL
jgi:nucleoside phosphorylase